MAQVRTLRKNELKQLIDVTASCSRYPQRDVTMLLFSHMCGLQVGEIAGLRFDDVLDDKSNVLTKSRWIRAERRVSVLARYFCQSKCRNTCKNTWLAYESARYTVFCSLRRKRACLCQHRYTALTAFVRACWLTWRHIS